MPISLDHPQVYLESSRFLGHFAQKRTPEYLVLGQDGGQSVALDRGNLFFFSDTLLLVGKNHGGTAHTAPVPIPSSLQSNFLANCAAVSSSPKLVPALASLDYFLDEEGLPREIIKATEREQFRRLRFWPEHGVLLNGRVYFYYLGVQTTDASSIWGFRNLGAGLAALDPATGECERFQYRNDWIFWRNTREDLHFGVQVLLEDYVYIFGSVRDGIQNEATLARVQPNCITDRDAYEYLATPSGTWTPRFEDACTLGPSSSTYSVSFNAYLGCYTMWMVDEYRKCLKLRTARNIWGPYSETVDLIGLPHDPSSALIYLGFEHPQFREQDGRRIFLSYCEPNFATSSLIALTLGVR